MFDSTTYYHLHKLKVQILVHRPVRLRQAPQHFCLLTPFAADDADGTEEADRFTCFLLITNLDCIRNAAAT